MIARILVADDNPEIRSLLREYLESRHHIVFEASDGAQAFMIAEQEVPHLVITDIVMPGIYGTTATKKLQDYWRTSKIPVIIISGSAGEEQLVAFLENPKVRFLKKPLDLKLLEATISELLPEGGITP